MSLEGEHLAHLFYFYLIKFPNGEKKMNRLSLDQISDLILNQICKNMLKSDRT